MNQRFSNLRPGLIAALGAATLFAACGGDDDDPAPLPRLSAATPASLSGTCADLAPRLATLANTTRARSTGGIQGRAASITKGIAWITPHWRTDIRRRGSR